MEENYELAKWLAGEMTEAELKAFQNTPEYETYSKIAAFSTQLEAPVFDENLLYQKVIATDKVKTIPLHQKWWFKMAAVIVVFLGLTLFYKNNIAVSQYSDHGERTSFSLPDHSEVVLNSGSEIDYTKWNWKNHRQLTLNGEAYFKVAKGKKFEVNTNLGKVTVVGTQFNVKARKNRFDVTCYEGCVRVNYQNEEVFITKGKRVAFENGTAINVPNTNTTQPEWTKGEITFAEENLNTILSELERQYDCSFELNNYSSEQLFTGTLPLNNKEEALQILTSIYHLRVKKVVSDQIILEPIDVGK